MSAFKNQFLSKIQSKASDIGNSQAGYKMISSIPYHLWNFKYPKESYGKMWQSNNHSMWDGSISALWLHVKYVAIT